MRRFRCAVGLLLAVVCGCQQTGGVADAPSGRRLYESKCSRCHLPWPVHKYTPAEWPAKVWAMAPRAGLTPDGARRVIAYLQEASAGP